MTEGRPRAGLCCLQRTPPTATPGRGSNVPIFQSVPSAVQRLWLERGRFVAENKFRTTEILHEKACFGCTRPRSVQPCCSCFGRRYGSPPLHQSAADDCCCL